MKTIRILAYALLLLVFFVILHYFFPVSLSGTKAAIDNFFKFPLQNWWFIFPLLGIAIIFILILYYGIHFLASFGKGFRSKEENIKNISIMIASKDEMGLLERTLDSIINCNYPLSKIQLILITSGSTDGTTEYCQEFANKYEELETLVLADQLEKKGKPPALNYGLKYVKNEIIILYDSGCILEPDTLEKLIAPFNEMDANAVIGPVLVENWKENALTKGILLDYTIVSGGGLLFEIKNRLGSSAYSFGRNFAVSTKFLKKYGGFNEDSMTEDLYLSVLLNLDNVPIIFSPEAKIYEYVPSTWEILKKQRTRWIAGFTYDMPQLMAMKSEDKNGQSIIISRNLTMMLIGNLDTWLPIVIAFSILYFLIGEYYLLTWNLILVAFMLGFLVNAVRKYGDKHYSILLYFLISGYIHLFMFLAQFSLPEEMSWEKTPMLFQREEEEVSALSTK
ncbi:MAG: glycosyltransferase [Candidatus Lokiarchaeota archaeon]|nr:glycosyltransferase [Candidatus Lokiarchaeota archaeon]MBD3201336.1 glycosyltransferase [Candidatus Lokiarchaeota archaeon]